MAACCQLAGAEVLARSGRIGDPPTQQRFQQIPWGLRHLRDRPEKCDAPPAPRAPSLARTVLSRARAATREPSSTSAKHAVETTATAARDLTQGRARVSGGSVIGVAAFMGVLCAFAARRRLPRPCTLPRIPNRKQANLRVGMWQIPGQRTIYYVSVVTSFQGRPP